MSGAVPADDDGPATATRTDPSLASPDSTLSTAAVIQPAPGPEARAATSEVVVQDRPDTLQDALATEVASGAAGAVRERIMGLSGASEADDANAGPTARIGNASRWEDVERDNREDVRTVPDSGESDLGDRPVGHPSSLVERYELMTDPDRGGHPVLPEAVARTLPLVSLDIRRGDLNHTGGAGGVSGGVGNGGVVSPTSERRIIVDRGMPPSSPVDGNPPPFPGQIAPPRPSNPFNAEEGQPASPVSQHPPPGLPLPQQPQPQHQQQQQYGQNFGPAVLLVPRTSSNPTPNTRPGGGLNAVGASLQGLSLPPPQVLAPKPRYSTLTSTARVSQPPSRPANFIMLPPTPPPSGEVPPTPEDQRALHAGGAKGGGSQGGGPQQPLEWGEANGAGPPPEVETGTVGSGLAALKGLIRDALPAKVKPPTFDFDYGDRDGFEGEVNEFYNFQDNPFVQEGREQFEATFSKEWKNESDSEREAYVLLLLECLELRNPEERYAAAKRLLYISQGVFGECSSVTEQLDWIHRNNRLLLKLDGFSHFHQALRIVSSTLDVITRSVAANATPASPSNPATTTSANGPASGMSTIGAAAGTASSPASSPPGGQGSDPIASMTAAEKQAAMDLANAETSVYLSLCYMMIEVNMDNPLMAAEVAASRGGATAPDAAARNGAAPTGSVHSHNGACGVGAWGCTHYGSGAGAGAGTEKGRPIAADLFDLVSQLAEGFRKHYPLKKLLLLLWKVLLITVGTRERLGGMKNAARRREGLAPLTEKDLYMKSTPQDVHQFQTITSLKYPAYYVPDVMSASPRNLPLTEPFSSGVKRILLQNGPQLQPFIKPRSVLTAASARRRGRGGTSISSEGSGNYSSSAAAAAEAAAAFDLLPKSFQETVRVLRKHLYVSHATVQAARERVEMEKAGMETLGSGAMTLGLAGSKGVSAFEGRGSVVAGPGLPKRGKVAGPGAASLKMVERLYSHLAPNMATHIGILIRLLYYVNLGNSVPGQQEGGAEMGGANGDYPTTTPEASFSSMTLEQREEYLDKFDVVRHKETVTKAISGILLILLKATKCDHVLKFEYISQLLVDNNCAILILKMLSTWFQNTPNANAAANSAMGMGGGDANVAPAANVNAWLKEKEDPKELNFFYFSRAGNLFEQSLDTKDEEEIMIDASEELEATSLIAAHSAFDHLPPPVSSPDHQTGSERERSPTATSPGGGSVQRGSWRNFFTAINLLRVLQKLTKKKTHRILALVQWKASAVLKRVIKVNHVGLQLYALKLLKSQIPYLGRKWRGSNMKVITAVFLHLRPYVKEEYLSGEVEVDVDEALALEQSLRSLINYYHSRHHPESFASANADANAINNQAQNGANPQLGQTSRNPFNPRIPSLSQQDHDELENILSIVRKGLQPSSASLNDMGPLLPQSDTGVPSSMTVMPPLGRNLYRHRVDSDDSAGLDDNFMANYEVWLHQEVYNVGATADSVFDESVSGGRPANPGHQPHHRHHHHHTSTNEHHHLHHQSQDDIVLLKEDSDLAPQAQQPVARRRRRTDENGHAESFVNGNGHACQGDEDDGAEEEIVIDGGDEAREDDDDGLARDDDEEDEDEDEDEDDEEMLAYLGPRDASGWGSTAEPWWNGDQELTDAWGVPVGRIETSPTSRSGPGAGLRGRSRSRGVIRSALMIGTKGKRVGWSSGTADVPPTSPVKSPSGSSGPMSNEGGYGSWVVDEMDNQGGLIGWEADSPNGVHGFGPMGGSSPTGVIAPAPSPLGSSPSSPTKGK